MKYGFLLLTASLLIYSCKPKADGEMVESADTTVIGSITEAEPLHLSDYFPYLPLPYSLETDTLLVFNTNNQIDSVHTWNELLPEDLPLGGTTCYGITTIEKGNPGERYALYVYGYETVGGQQGIRIASFDAMEKKIDEIEIWSSSWLDNPAGSSKTTLTISDLVEITIRAYQYDEDHPDKEKIENTPPSVSMDYVLQMGGEFVRIDEPMQ